MKFRFLITLFFSALYGTGLYSEALFSGSVNSVDHDSGFNALRNPALICRQSRDSAGIFYFYSSNLYNEISGDVNISFLTNTKIDASSDEKYNGTLSASYVKKFKHSALGLAIRKPEGTDQAAISESSFALTGEYYPGPVYIKNNSAEEKKSYAISTVISWSGELGRYQSAGIQLETGMSSSTTEKNKTESGLSAKDYDMKIIDDKLICNINCGYYYSEKKYSTGAVIKFGEYVREKQEYSYRNNLTPFDENRKNIQPYFFRNRGLEYTLGFRYNITNRFHINMEGDIGAPFENKKKELKDDDSGVMAEKNSRSFVKYTLGAAAGLGYRYNRNLNLGFGGGSQIFSSDAEDENSIKTGETDYIIYSLIAGAEIKPAEGVNVLLGLSTYYYKSRMKQETSSLMMELQVENIYLNFIAGASVFY